MAAFNRFLMILIAILAIGAAVLSFLLFQRRTEFRDRASLLADATSDMVESLDKQSGTNVSRKVSFSPADPELGTKESGTLSLFSYHDDAETGYSGFAANLRAAEELAESINEQRNYLAQKLDDVAFALQMPQQELNVEDLKNASDESIYVDASEKILSLAQATSARTDQMIRTLLNCSETIGHSFEDTMLRSRETRMDDSGQTVMGPFRAKDQLQDFEDAVEGLHDRAERYADSIVTAINELVTEWQWQADSERVRSKLGYRDAMAAVEADFRGINDELRRSKERKAAIVDLEAELAEAKTELADVEKRAADLQTKVADQAILIAELNTKINRMSPGREGGVVEKFEVNPNLKGHVVQVNRDWNFVILDLGEEEVYENLPLLVSRNDEFMGKIFVTKVAKNISVAEIDASLVKGEISAGDMVILPDEFGM